MQGIGEYRLNPGLREVVIEASLALARLDADRLEELAHSCAALNRGLPMLIGAERAELERQARDASAEMAVFGRVLEATRANVEVMSRVRERARGRLEYAARPGTRSAAPWALAETCDGNH